MAYRPFMMDDELHSTQPGSVFQAQSTSTAVCIHDLHHTVGSARAGAMQ